MKFKAIFPIEFLVLICWPINTLHKLTCLYLCEDVSGHQLRRFHEAKRESGFDRLISLNTFKAATNGYLIDDSCVFGVEIHEVKNTGNGETIKMFSDPLEATFDWKIREFSRISKEKVYPEKLDSEEFRCGQSKW